MAFPNAVPTEYLGVLYRSKCEAMFARFLELQIETDMFMARHATTPWYRENSVNTCAGGFLYEPSLDDRWKPDFLLWRVNASTQKGSVPYPFLGYTVIEYKPSLPTSAYRLAFARNCRRLEASSDALGRYEFSRRCSYEIYYGSIYHPNRGRFSYENIGDGDLVEFHDGEDWLANYEELVSATRFDLVNA